MSRQAGACEPDKVAAVDRWLSAVSAASMRWKTADAAQRSSERVVQRLREVSERASGPSPEIDAQIALAVESNRRNAEALAAAAQAQARLEGGFYDVIAKLSRPEVAEAWRMRCIEHKTWLQCSVALHYNRQHLERSSRLSKAEAYDLIPAEYKRHG